MATTTRSRVSVEPLPVPGSADLYSDFYENAPDMLFSIEVTSGRILHCNQTAATKLGYSKRRLLGMNIFDLYHPDSRGDARSAFRTFLSKGRIENTESNFRRKNGEALHISFSASAVYRGSRIVRSRSICRDIIDLKQAKLALERSEKEARARAEELRAILDAVPAMIFIAHDRACRKMTSSKVAYELLRLPWDSNASKSAPLSERPPFRVFQKGKEVGNRNLPVQTAARSGRHVRDQELEIRFPDSSCIHVFGHSVPLLGHDGEVRGAVGAFVDISESKRAEVQIRENEARLRKFIESNVIGIVTASEAEGIREANNVFLEMMGMKRRTLEKTKLTWADLTPSEHIRRGLQAIAGLKQTGTLLPYETEYLRSDGSRVSVLIGGVAIRREPLEWMCFVVDLTEQKKAEAARQRQILQQQLLEREITARETERSRIARELHDEVGQLLASMLAGLRVVEDSQTTTKSSLQARALQETVAHTMGELERIVHGLHSLSLDDFGLVAALRNKVREYGTVHKLRAQIDIAGLESGRLPQPIEAGIYRIVQEALTNTVRHAAATRVRIRIKRNAKEIVLHIIDNGRGFNTGILNESRHNHLGIRGMQERATMMGGVCTIVSKKGRGTHISVNVPLTNDDSLS